ncbi:phosphoribosylamine--glycine ligase [Desulfovibrio subterraneus]|uniref:Phosphoribosylamine--glycine ligase n=1 Tax=Desulfovibrio subterraneus TaxID=2718620 RepID=A0A7J0BFK6_9BACT|nr:phosphoribosylamine--glycine ligase [Desulfovibrio subterraneus]WBF66784.1 phosphoribosylamine--glycine ligase [Desulfovibrio subterraneus]GFM32503.1 phosphoribosylamine--glycine ligase [Desulfovibrio subterraneus]
MRILIVGNGGREHALAWKMRQSPKVDEIFIAPGNGGTALEGTNVPIAVDDIPALVAFAKEQKIDLVVPGPELPLVLGIKDALDLAGIPCFGPNAFAAQLEGSKAFAKNIMDEAGVPTAAFGVFDEFEDARDYVLEVGAPIVVKADGLAAGKGVVVAQTTDEAIGALEEIMIQQAFGASGKHVVIEECLIGEEASFICFCDGKTVKPLPSSQDHKAVFDGDTGPNTGGMGAYSPAPVLPAERYDEIIELVMKPVCNTLGKKDKPFVGILYAGLMMTAKGPYVLEFNVRFGDPECQPLLMRLDSDIVDVMMACVEGRLAETPLNIKQETTLGVVIAAEGYPNSYPRGMEINGIEEAEAIGDLKVFQAGTTLEDGVTRANGGRVLCVTALGATLADAQKRAYEGVAKLRMDKAYYRRDIGFKGLK